ncbi:hypothetical protein SHKM778_62760 [Streptomyces sp. KM77-8]|uniref:Uncharacterized protein n=1 Tax=Streptomyces haneummycinicus TaxID=3074435 RepID=A0AAT9HRF2_9ACTN
MVGVLGGGLAGVSYFGYQFYQDRFGSAPDFAGAGNGEQVTVTIPKGSGGYAIGQVLKKAGVVASVDAFVAAQGPTRAARGSRTASTRSRRRCRRRARSS